MNSSNTMKMRRIHDRQPRAAARLGVAAAVFFFAMAAPAAASPRDAWITTKVKLALLTADGTDPVAVNVDTVNRKVTLHGKVHSTETRDSAERVALAVEGTDSVRNLLQVVPKKREALFEEADDVLTRHVETALKAEKSLGDSSVSVQSVNKGVVLLQGKAANLGDHLTAVRIALDTPGVRRVASQIQSSDAVADEEIWREGAVVAAPDPPATGLKERPGAEAPDRTAAVKDGAAAVKNTASDLYITSRVKMNLLADEKAPAMDINVDTTDGAVTLFGIVPSREAALAAVDNAQAVRGVTFVKDELEIVASEIQPVVEANDEVIQGNVEKKLEARPELKDVDVEVRNCVARLTGSVPSGFERVEALQVARATQGVCAVRDDLRFHD